MEEEIRLQKYFTDCGIMSRRAAEKEIELGNVLVNGKVAELGRKVKPGIDVIEYLGKEIKPAEDKKTVCIMLNKPRGFLTSMSDDRDRRCVPELLQGVETRVYPIGRLDYNSEGLLLLTNDGELANILTHPRHEIPKIYRVTTVGIPSEEQIEALREPMDIDGYGIQPVDVKIVSELPNNMLLEFTLYEGRNRQIRKMCESVGVGIKRLVRVAVGKLKIGKLKCGEWRYLTDAETEYLKNAKDGER